MDAQWSKNHPLGVSAQTQGQSKRKQGVWKGRGHLQVVTTK